MNDKGTRAVLVEQLRAIVGEAAVITDGNETAAYENDWRDQYHGRAACVVRPANTDEVSKVVAACAGAGVAIVPQGGNTSLCGASVPDASGTQVIVNLSRMNKVREIDATNNTMTVEAGCVLAAIQQAADAHDRLFPLSLAAEGSCEIGGNLSTNAGGTQVLRYGNTRDLVLGLEVVLADGRVWNGLRALRKDNTGYDLKHLFVGAEGTLGIITAAVLKLFSKPRSIATAFVAVPGPDEAVALLSRLRAACGDRVTGYELIARICLDLVFRHIPGMADPFNAPHPWYVLVELSDSTKGGSLSMSLENALADGAEAGEVLDGVLASSNAQAEKLWALRENITEAQKVEGASVKHDVSVPVSRVPDLIRLGGAALKAAYPDIRIVAFGHVGDGNIHYNCSQAEQQAAADFMAQGESVNRIVYDVVQRLGGSISAEHGLGQLKREEIKHYKSALELELMARVKMALDPHGLMNPGKVL
jgi:FAD/FMN-containing dehydrogenase